MGRNAISMVNKFFPNVRSVVDAKRNVEIRVLGKDCNTASVKNHKQCAMAQACKRQLGIDGAIISVGTAYTVQGDKATRYRIPERVSREIIAFDRNGGFMPGVYKLDKPTGGQKLGRVVGKPTGRKHPHKTSMRHFATNGIRATLNRAVA